MKNSYSQLFVIFIILSGLTFVSCKKEENEITSKAGLIPLKAGNSWSYKIYRSDIVVDTLVLTIGDYITFNGYQGFKFISGVYPFHEIFMADNDKDGNFVSMGGYSDKDTLLASSIKYKRGAVKGDSWKYDEIWVNSDGTFEKANIDVFCVNVDTTITTSVGNFKCKVYKWSPDSGADMFYDYLSENTGIIKSEHFEGTHLFSYQVLFEYNIDK